MRDTAHLSMVEDCAYRRLLDAYYARERALPGDARECCKLARAASKPERDAVAYVLREFFQVGEDGLHHQRRADDEIAKFRAKSEKARASINARWDRTRSVLPTNNERNTDVLRTNAERNTPRARPQSPDTSNQKEQKQEQARPPLRGSRLPTDCPSDSDLAWAKRERPDLDAGLEREKFRDHWTAKAGKDGSKLDWPATWRNWIRGARLVAAPRAGPQSAPQSKTAAAYHAIGATIDELNRKPAAPVVRIGHSGGDSQPDSAQPRSAACDGSDRSGDLDLDQRPVVRPALGSGQGR